MLNVYELSASTKLYYVLRCCRILLKEFYSFRHFELLVGFFVLFWPNRFRMEWWVMCQRMAVYNIFSAVSTKRFVHIIETKGLPT